MIKNYIRQLSNDQSSGRYWIYLLFLYVRNNKFLGFFYFLIMVFYSYILSFRLFGCSLRPKICFSRGIFRIQLSVGKNAFLQSVKGMIIFEKWRSGIVTIISLEPESRLIIDDTFVIGDNCKIALSKGARLNIGGKLHEYGSGITADTVILCSKEIEIGKGTIISWGCYISDSSQHQFNGVLKKEPVIIGEYVWISEGVTCGPGLNIGSGSVVGAKSYANKIYPNKSFIAGCPAKVIKQDITWKR